MRFHPTRRLNGSSDPFGSRAYTSAISAPARVPVFSTVKARGFCGRIDTQVGIPKGGVGQAVTESKERLFVLDFEPLVTNCCTFVVMHCELPGRTVRKIGCRQILRDRRRWFDYRPGKIVFTLGKRQGKFATWIDVSDQHVGQRLMTELPAYHASTTPATLSTQGIVTAEPVSRTTMV